MSFDAKTCARALCSDMPEQSAINACKLAGGRKHARNPQRNEMLGGRRVSKQRSGSLAR